MQALVKITSKDQVNIPKKIRKLLGTDVVRFRVIEGKIVLEPVRDLGGIFFGEAAEVLKDFLLYKGVVNRDKSLLLEAFNLFLESKGFSFT